MNLTHSPSSPHDASGLLFAGFNQVQFNSYANAESSMHYSPLTFSAQDFGCFAVGLRNGFRVFNADPLVQQTRKGRGF